MEQNSNSISRRQFLGRSVLGLTAAAAGPAFLSKEAHAGPGDKPNPFALNTEGMRETDPKLISHVESRAFQQLFPEARRISLAADHLYVAAGNAVSVLNLKGEQQSSIEFPEPVRCAAGAGDGRIFIGLKHRVEVRDVMGGSITGWDIPGTKTWLSGMAAGKSDLYLADSGNRVVLRYSFDGKPLGRIGEKNTERNIPGIVLPSPYLQVALGTDGLLRVNNPGRHRVDVYAPDGDLEMHWGVAGGGISGFCGCCNPIGIAVLPDGSCINCEKGNPRVKLYDTDGTFKSVVARAELFPNNARSGAARRADGLLGGLDAVAGPDGRVYVLDLVSGQVRVMMPIEAKKS